MSPEPEPPPPAPPPPPLPAAARDAEVVALTVAAVVEGEAAAAAVAAAGSSGHKWGSRIMLVRRIGLKPGGSASVSVRGREGEAGPVTASHSHQTSALSRPARALALPWAVDERAAPVLLLFGQLLQLCRFRDGRLS